MPNDKDTAGKVIVSLLAGATAGIVAGLLLAPETGEEARHGLRASARKWGQRAQEAFDKLQSSPTSGPNADQGRQAADAQLRAMRPNAEPGDLATPAGAGNGYSIAGDDDYDVHNRADLDYDGDAGEGRHRATL
ncbi:YtxH domain-containing protein [Hymenobacter psoromatis]|uniref:YtxH domain-containing protein n=1 Tax=Hymenobacter psoromatis TaxID=1484116 RepID=UPI001CBE7AFA|nr:YtxH domain-containing protein [Hymenobacter psoromatis]